MSGNGATYNFDRLTPRQEQVLGQIAIGIDGGHHPRTLEALERRGLIEGRDEVIPLLRGRLTIRRYVMPIAAHIAWCEWCAGHCGDEA
jgi:hypothetical protein